MNRLVTALLVISFALHVDGVRAAAESPPDPSKLPDPAGWIEVTSANFTLYSNESEVRTRKIATQLELFRAALGRVWRELALDARIPTSMFVFRNAAGLAPYRVDERGQVMNVSGYFRPAPHGNFIALDASAGEQPLRVVYHEYFHAVMNATLGTLPTWLGEGLAEWFSTFKAAPSLRSIEAGHPIVEHVYTLQTGKTLPWANVFDMTLDSPAYNEEDRQGPFYAQSWIVVHYLLAEDAKAVGQYLTLLRGGADPDEAIGAAFGASRVEIGTAAERYRTSKEAGHAYWTLPETETTVSVAVRPLAPAEVFLRLGDLLAHGGPRAAAETHLEAARAAGAPAAAVESALGVTASLADDDTAAEAHLRRAVAGGRGSTEAVVLLATVLLDRGYARFETATTSERPPELLEARTLLQGAVERDAGSTAALIALARTYLLDTDTGPGVAAIVKAREARPLDLDLAEMHACLLGSAGGTKDAWPLVEHVIAPRSPEAAERAAACVAYGAFNAARSHLEAGDRAGATAIVEQALATITDSAARANLVRLQDLLSRGGEVQFVDARGATGAGNAEIDRLNEAVAMANRGELDRALAHLGALTACTIPAVCERATALSTQLRERITTQQRIDRYNDGIALLNAGKRKEAIAAFRALEHDVTDPEMLREIRKILDALGVKPAD